MPARRPRNGPAVHEQPGRELGQRGVGGTVPRVRAQTQALAHVARRQPHALPHQRERRPGLRAQSVQVVEGALASDQHVHRGINERMDDGHPVRR